MNNIKNALDRFFGISQRNSSIRIEMLAGLTTFITMAYILILNPQILSAPYAMESYLHFG